MFQILLDDTIFYDVRDKDLNIESPNLDLEINKVGTLKFKVYPSHPYFNNLENKVSKFTVKKGNKTIFKGRMVNEEQGIYNSKNIEVEGSLAYLNDSVVRPYTFNGTPAQHFTNLINNHNSQVSDYQKFKIGTITVTDPNDYIARSSESYGVTWKIIEEDLINKLGGYLRIRYENDGTYIDYLEDFEDTSTQVIELGKNLIDVLVKNNAAEVYSVVIPLGAEQEEVVDETTGEVITPKQRLTIESVNNNLDYLVNETALAKYGWIVAPTDETTFEDVTVASNLKTKGQNFLDNQAVMLNSTLEVSAVDLNLTDSEIEAFFIYEYIRFVSKVHNINETFLCTKISIPMKEPQNMKITLGEETSSLTGIQMGNGSKVDDLVNRVESVEANYVLNADVTNIVNTAITNNTSILQSAEEIIMNALQDYVTTNDFETFQETVSTQFVQTAEDFTFNFNNLVSQITTIEGDTQQQFQEINKYIRFEDGNIILGETGNEIILKIENDRISFLQNNNEVAYMSNNKLTITDGDFLVSLKIGNFAFKPRSNGNLSLVYVGGDTVG